MFLVMKHLQFSITESLLSPNMFISVIRKLTTSLNKAQSHHEMNRLVVQLMKQQSCVKNALCKT
jgi:hypothetical protein